MRVTKPGGKLLSAELLGPGFVQVVQIAAVQMEKCGADEKAVLYFAGHEKGLPLNAINIDMLVTLFNTDESEFWIGRSIELFTTMTSYAGRARLGIRVRPVSLPVHPSPPAPPPLRDAVPAAARAREPGDDDGPLTQPMTHSSIRW